MRIPAGSPLSSLGGLDRAGRSLNAGTAAHLPPVPAWPDLAGRPRGHRQARRDEWLSAASHAVAGLATLAAMPALVIQATTWSATLAGGIFLVALMATFAFSAWLHVSRPATARRNWLGLIDRCAIFVLIAATYTPLAGLSLTAPWNVAVLTTVWLLAVAGIGVNAYGFYRLRGFDRLEPVNLVLYLGQGWCAPVVLAPVFLAALSNPALAWVAAGGIAYSVGVIFYCWPGLAYNHTIWHLFVIAGAACHGWAVLFHALPAG